MTRLLTRIHRLCGEQFLGGTAFRPILLIHSLIDFCILLQHEWHGPHYSFTFIMCFLSSGGKLPGGFNYLHVSKPRAANLTEPPAKHVRFFSSNVSVVVLLLVTHPVLECGLINIVPDKCYYFLNCDTFLKIYVFSENQWALGSEQL